MYIIEIKSAQNLWQAANDGTKLLIFIQIIQWHGYEIVISRE